MVRGPRIASILVSALMAVSAAAQDTRQPKVADIPRQQAGQHRIGTQGVIRSDKAESQFIFRNGVALDVVIGIDGRVESVKAIDGRKPFYGQAEAIEREQQFQPFEENGQPVRAHFTDYVMIFPPEQWGEKTAFPEIRNWNSLRMKLTRTGCFGTCPDYEVEVRGDGSVAWRGNMFVLITGQHKAHMSKDAVKELFERFREADYFSLKDKYVTSVTDCPTFTTSIEFDGHKKSVVDYMGLESGMPTAVADLELTIDETAGTKKWIKETDETWPALVDEGWDFKSPSEQNRTLFASVAKNGSSELTAKFLAAGAPAVAMGRDGESALENAAQHGDLTLIRRMLEGEKSAPPGVMFLALRAAALDGNLESVRYLIERGADVNGISPRPKDQTTVLMAAAASGNAEVIHEILLHHPAVDAREVNGQTALMILVASSPEKSDITPAIHELLAAGANVSARDEDGRTALFGACGHAAAVKVLAAAGADLNAKNRIGETALMQCFDPEVDKAMLAAGADPSIRNQDGLTAAEQSRKMGAEEAAAVIEDFVRERQGK